MARTPNYTVPVWMVLFVIVIVKWKEHQRINPLLPLTILIGFAGIILMLQPTLDNKQWLDGFIGLLAGRMSAIAFLHVAVLGKVGAPGYRVVFFFSVVGDLQRRTRRKTRTQTRSDT